jgi:hypothetical protein
MFIRFVSGDIDADLHVEKGLFYAAYRLRYADDLPEYELDRLLDLLGHSSLRPHPLSQW